MNMEIVNQKGRKLSVVLFPDAPNVAKHTTKTGNVDYWIRDPVLGVWKFAHQKRFDGMIKRFGTVKDISALYISPEGKKVLEADENHPLRDLLDKQPKATRTGRKKKTSAKAAPKASKPKAPMENADGVPALSRSEERAALREKPKAVSVDLGALGMEVPEFTEAELDEKYVFRAEDGDTVFQIDNDIVEAYNESVVDMD